MLARYLNRVLELGEVAFEKPCILKFPLVAALNFTDGEAIPKGGLVLVSPHELSHALIFRIASRLDDGADAAECSRWYRVLLSSPCTFQVLDSHDAKFAKANSLRSEVQSLSRAVVHTARQTIYNVWGFKERKEKDLGRAIGAAEIADFWAANITESPGGEKLHKKTTIDACLTLKERLFDLPECEEIVAASEQAMGPDSAWNQVYKLQEIVYRASTPDKIIWLMSGLSDQVSSHKIDHKDITISALKTGGKSMSDPILQAQKTKAYLLGPWLDSKNFAPFIKAKVREIFRDHASWRKLYNPLHASADTTWCLGWPKAGKLLCNFIEGAIYNPTHSEESLMRQSVRHGKKAEELMTWSIYIYTYICMYIYMSNIYMYIYIYI